jgi:hypothetical protein
MCERLVHTSYIASYNLFLGTWKFSMSHECHFHRIVPTQYVSTHCAESVSNNIYRSANDNIISFVYCGSSIHMITMEYARKMILVDPHSLEQLQVNLSHEQSQSAKGCGSILSRDTMSLDDASQCPLKPPMDNILRQNYDTTRARNTCSYCEKMFSKRTNYLRHLGLIHHVDASGKPIEEATLQRYKDYNHKANSSESAGPKRRNQRIDDAPGFRLELDRILNSKEERTNRYDCRMYDSTNLMKKKACVIGKGSYKHRSSKMRTVAPVQENTMDKQRIKKIRNIGKKSAEEAPTKKRTMSPEQRRILKRKIIKTWLPY